MEADGLGIPPDNVRSAILREGGLWRVQLSAGMSIPVVAKVLRSALGLAPKEAIARASQNAQAIWKGTKVEVEWLVKMLSEAGVDASAVQEISSEC